MTYKYEEIKEHFNDWLTETEKHEPEFIMLNKDEPSEIHNYYIIGTEKAINWMGSFVFDIINTIKKYEQDNFGEVTTDLSSPEKLVNMYAYIVGEQVVDEWR